MTMESRPAGGLEKEDDTNSSTEYVEDEDDSDDNDNEDGDEDDDEEEDRTNNNNESELVIPSNFICPLTLEIMKDPLISRHGQSYERRAIMEWIHQGNATCPMTRQPLRLSGLITNHALKAQIEQWKKQNNYKHHTKMESKNAASQAKDKTKKKKRSKKYDSAERILGMYCNFLEETTDRSRDDPPMILEWRRPASEEEDNNEMNAATLRTGRRRATARPNASTQNSTTTSTSRSFWTRFRSKPNNNTAAPTTMV